MLKIYGNVYSDRKENFAEVVKALENSGFEVAYGSENNGTIVKEVASLVENEDESNNSES